jgi:hypothetical protein
MISIKKKDQQLATKPLFRAAKLERARWRRIAPVFPNYPTNRACHQSDL